MKKTKIALTVFLILAVITLIGSVISIKNASAAPQCVVNSCPAGQVPTIAGPIGPRGATGPRGLAGPTGAAGVCPDSCGSGYSVPDTYFNQVRHDILCPPDLTPQHPGGAVYCRPLDDEASDRPPAGLNSAACETGDTVIGDATNPSFRLRIVDSPSTHASLLWISAAEFSMRESVPMASLESYTRRTILGQTRCLDTNITYEPFPAP